MYRTSLNGTFAAGTVLLPFCGLQRAKDSGWINFTDYQFDWKSLALRSSESYILEIVDYLVRTDFICATTKSDPLGLTYVRVYIIPAHSPGVIACLRTLKPAVHSARTEALRTVLGFTDTSVDAWEGRAVSRCIGKPFFEHCVFQDTSPRGASLSQIFQGLASPSIDERRLDDTSRLRIEIFLRNESSGECVPGLRSRLYPYQSRLPLLELSRRRCETSVSYYFCFCADHVVEIPPATSVAKMLQEELCAPDPKDPTYVAIRSPINDELFFVNPSSLVMRITPEEYRRPRRGASAILAEDPGSGKTIMVTLAWRHNTPSDKMVLDSGSRLVYNT